jgi:membrane fusion protein, multidrug efflux system
MKAYRQVGLVALVAAAASGCGGGGDARNASASTVQAATLGASDLAVATRTTLVAGVSLSGALEPKVNVVLGAPIAEQLVEMLVNEGDPVRQGQPVARFRDDVLRSASLSAQADLATAQSQVRMAAAESTRAEALFAEGAIARRDHDNTLLALETARARLALTQSQAASAADRLETATLKSPVTGVVSQRHAQAGDRVDFGKPVLTIVNNSVLQLEASVEAQWLGALRVGRPVVLTLAQQASGDTIRGRLARINPTADPATRQVRIYVDVPNHGNLVGGLFVSGQVVVSEARGVVAVPRAAVRTEGAERVVYVVAEGRVARRPVTLGIEDVARGLIQLASGVRAGETVIVGPVEGLGDGVPVEVSGPGAAGPGR